MPQALYATVKSGPGKSERLLRWTLEAGWSDKGAVAGSVIEGSARSMGQAHVLYLVRVGDSIRLMMFHTITGSWATLGDPGAAGAVPVEVRGDHGVVIDGGLRSGVVRNQERNIDDVGF